MMLPTSTSSRFGIVRRRSWSSLRRYSSVDILCPTPTLHIRYLLKRTEVNRGSPQDVFVIGTIMTRVKVPNPRRPPDTSVFSATRRRSSIQGSLLMISQIEGYRLNQTPGELAEVAYAD